jgi:hypothetical protein
VRVFLLAKEPRPHYLCDPPAAQLASFPISFGHFLVLDVRAVHFSFS